jgi:hypothetical protein
LYLLREGKVEEQGKEGSGYFSALPFGNKRGKKHSGGVLASNQESTQRDLITFDDGVLISAWCGEESVLSTFALRECTTHVLWDNSCYAPSIYNQFSHVYTHSLPKAID